MGHNIEMVSFCGVKLIWWLWLLIGGVAFTIFVLLFALVLPDFLSSMSGYSYQTKNNWIYIYIYISE
jgi:hypothetical protein